MDADKGKVNVFDTLNFQNLALTFPENERKFS
jgi:hypothetical protein